MMKKFYILYDRRSPPVFGGGDVVSGRVVLELTGASRVQSLTAHAQGFARVHYKVDADFLAKVNFEDWCTVSDAMSFYAKYHQAEVEYLNQREVLLCADDGKPTTLPAGRHEFPFSFQLPEDTLVTSFQGKHGSIRYWVKVKLQRPWASVTEIKKEFTFIEPINVNTPSLLRSRSVTKAKNVTAWLCNIGHLSITAKIHRKGYTPGDVIPLFIEFHNSTSRSVTPMAYIVQRQTFMAEGSVQEKHYVVASQCGVELGPRCSEIWMGRPIRIPTVEPSILLCPIIRVEYMLRVCVEIRGTSKLCVELPLVMGTIPLCLSDSPTSPVSSQMDTTATTSLDPLGSSCTSTVSSQVTDAVPFNPYDSHPFNVSSGMDTTPPFLHPFGSSTVCSPYPEWLHRTFPEQRETPPEYSSVVTEEEAEQYTSSPPAYCEVDPYPQASALGQETSPH